MTKNSNSKVIELNTLPKIVFPLFGAIEEKRWATYWNPENFTSNSNDMERGATFITSHSNQFKKNIISMQRIFKENLKDWENAINSFLEKGVMLVAG